MKKLIKRLSRVADSAQYSLLRSEPQSPAAISSRVAQLRRYRVRSGAVPEGHLPVHVGEEMEKFVVSAELLNHPIFVELLDRSAQEYGYEQRGVLRIPCHVILFERVLESMRLGGDSVQDLLELLSDDHFMS